MCPCVTVCVNYLRLNKHLIFSACVHSNLLSLYICTHTYNIHTCIGMCTPTHILLARVFVCIVYLHLCFVLLGLPVYCEQLCSLSFSLSLSFRACTTPTHTYTRRAGLLGCVSVCVCVRRVHLLWLAFDLLKVTQSHTHTHAHTHRWPWPNWKMHIDKPSPPNSINPDLQTMTISCRC